MTIPDKIYEKYGSVWADGPRAEICVESEAALRIPADCEDADVAIIGVDTLTITPGSTFAHLDGILDYSPRVQQPWDEFRQQCNKAALGFMREMRMEKGANTYFAIVMMSAEEYERSQRRLR